MPLISSKPRAIVSSCCALPSTGPNISVTNIPNRYVEYIGTCLRY